MNKKESLISNMYDLEHTASADFLSGFEYPWEALSGIKAFIYELGKSLPADEYDSPSEGIWIHKTAKVFESAYIGAPCIIGPETEVRHCAFIRGAALIGSKCVVGNSTELKNVILFDNVQVPHYNYVGDSIYGFHSHTGAGTIASNLKSDGSDIVIHNEGEDLETGRRKIGAIVGDYGDVGCNTVMNPGTVIGKHSSVYPVSMVRGVVPHNSIYKDSNNIVLKK